MANIRYNAVVFHNQSDNERAPLLTGYISIPVSKLSEFFELVSVQRRFEDNGEDTVRIPLSLWEGIGKAPLAFKGQSSFLVANGGQAPKQTMKVVSVDPTPTV